MSNATRQQSKVGCLTRRCGEKLLHGGVSDSVICHSERQRRILLDHEGCFTALAQSACTKQHDNLLAYFRPRVLLTGARCKLDFQANIFRYVGDAGHAGNRQPIVATLDDRCTQADQFSF